METTILKARNNLSLLLHKVEQREEVRIRRGAKAPKFQMVPHHEPIRRTLEPDPQRKCRIAFRDEDIWASEWRHES